MDALLEIMSMGGYGEIFVNEIDAFPVSQDLCFSFFLHKHWFLISGFPKKQYKVSVRAAISLWGLLDFDVKIFFPHDFHSLPPGYHKQKIFFSLMCIGIIEEETNPQPREDQVLIKVVAASINPIDFKRMHGLFHCKGGGYMERSRLHQQQFCYLTLFLRVLFIGFGDLFLLYDVCSILRLDLTVIDLWKLLPRMQPLETTEPYSVDPIQLLAISVGDKMLNLLVIGCGPAGLALVAESAMLGLNIGLIGPNLPFTNNYGFGEDEFKDDTILIGCAYEQVSHHLLQEELLRRCVESGVSYHDLRVESIVGAAKGHSLVVCEQNIVISYRLVTVALGTTSGKLMEYEVGGPKVSVQTVYGVEVEGSLVPSIEEDYPTFLYVMPMSTTRFLSEVAPVVIISFVVAIAPGVVLDSYEAFKHGSYF
ncbi:hypothetical protein F8388_019552 [Cannabis sativa]|uniref:Uncharacterized protein n=1 Tax=Cannabis sativa TaxID=3483 RepID=A0A7J6FFB5_CANSA|nr:hypothetical protein F8388_019552 [Cannabis sativa]